MRYRYLYSFFYVFLLAACEGESYDASYKPYFENEAKDLGKAGNELESDFITFADEINEVDWLILKTTGYEPDEYAEREDISRLLELLDTVYSEDKRMIANRTVQTAKMLEENQLHFDLKAFLEGFAEIPSEGSMTVFGSYCQHYFNLRSNDLSHAQVINYMVSGRREINPN